LHERGDELVYDNKECIVNTRECSCAKEWLDFKTEIETMPSQPENNRYFEVDSSGMASRATNGKIPQALVDKNSRFQFGVMLKEGAKQTDLYE
jgi:hypothetical protein